MRKARVFLILIAAWIGLLATAGIYLSEGTVHLGRRFVTAQSVAAAQRLAVKQGTHLDDVGIASFDRAVLRGWYFEAKPGNGSAVILLHGQGDNRAGMLGYAEIFLRNHYDVLIPDSRAHGSSGGTLVTYGLRESEDVHQWASWLFAKHQPRCVFALGESMGAAVLLQSLTKESRFGAVVAESPFANFREIVYDRISTPFGVGPWLGRTLLRPLADGGLFYIHQRYHIRLVEASPEAAVANARTPILLIHDTQDFSIPLRHSKRILYVARARNVPVELWEVGGAAHCGAFGRQPEEFERRVLNWFRSQSQ